MKNCLLSYYNMTAPLCEFLLKCSSLALVILSVLETFLTDFPKIYQVHLENFILNNLRNFENNN